MKSKNLISLFCCLFILIIPVLIFAESPAESGRTILNKYQDAVVTVKLVIKQGVSYGGRDANKQESKIETTGTIIDSSGLTLISLFATDPSSIYADMMSMSGDDDMKVKIESEVTDVKIILSDGSEIPAKIVIRDKDLDMAFIRPTEKINKSIIPIDITKKTEAKILDEIIVLNRLGKVANRVPSVSIDRIEAVVDKPRKFYIPGQGSSTGGLGSPVFSVDGSFIGVVLLRSIKSDGGLSLSGALSSGTGGMGIIPIILPAEDILEASLQAPELATPKSNK